MTAYPSKLTSRRCAELVRNRATSGRATTKTGTSFRYAPLSSVYIRNAVTLDSQNDDYKRRQQSGSKSSLNRKDALVIGGAGY